LHFKKNYKIPNLPYNREEVGKKIMAQKPKHFANTAQEEKQRLPQSLTTRPQKANFPAQSKDSTGLLKKLGKSNIIPPFMPMGVRHGEKAKPLLEKEEEKRQKPQLLDPTKHKAHTGKEDKHSVTTHGKAMPPPRIQRPFQEIEPEKEERPIEQTFPHQTQKEETKIKPPPPPTSIPPRTQTRTAPPPNILSSANYGLTKTTFVFHYIQI
jgi:hypothetical protein